MSDVWFCEWPGELAHLVDAHGARRCGAGLLVKVTGPNAIELAGGRCSNCERMERRGRHRFHTDGAQRISR